MFDNRLQPSNEPFIPSSYTTTEQAQPLFTLTAEEVEEIKQLLEKEISDLNHTRIFYSNMQLWLDKYNKTNNLLTRINDYQNGH